MRWLIALALVAACGGKPRILVGPRSTQWHVAVSPHFEVYSDASIETLRQRVETLERAWWGLASIYQGIFRDRVPPAMRLAVLHWRNCDEAFGSAGVGGYVIYTGEYSIGVVCERGERDEVITHELTHLFNAYYIGATPRWLNEGLASYFATLRLDGTRLEIGRPATQGWRPPGAFDPLAWQPTVKALFAANWRDRHVYRAAWTLVHALIDDDGLRRRFFAYLVALAAGTPNERAWAEAFAGADVEHAFQEHRQATMYRARSFPVKPAPRVPVAVYPIAVERVLDVVVASRGALEGGVHKLPPEMASKLVAELDALAREYPLWKGAPYWRARIAMLVEDRAAVGLDEPTAILRAHLARTPNDTRARALLIRLEVRRGDRDRLLAMEAEVRALARAASTPGELLAVARYYAALARPETGLAWAHRALRVWPRCDECEHVLADMLAQKGDFAGALAHEQRAIGIFAEKDPPADYLRAARKYRAQLGAAGQPPR